ncbi:hypothetical protein DCS_04454 [Drechmeria coniospora]|uniref:Uncharacterized protein n=1 Tax=Drechmeria coniospora TaxID=98403 RepID=A0A151GK08_DRECN|nr:hypothetical protein DCS_04454 [Drechmeria coniospora]KYK57445.1 hypothetical protein DCS_04454 [Drechmeria coniospora]ODA79350.1 hypothetical protein RJ55_04943 [Drechmeria coniospora]
MASLQMHSGGSKITKSRNRTVVKPILKKLHSHHSDRESLDLDRGWDDQPSPRLASLDFGRSDPDAGGLYAPTNLGKSTRDAAYGGPKHARSTSGASVATSNSGGRNGGSFVHPFQQMPQLDSSPTITEDDGNEDADLYPSSHAATAPTARPAAQTAPLQQSAAGPSLPTQCTTSSSDSTQTSRLAASRSNSGSVQRLISTSVNQSCSELQPSAGTSVVDSPLSPSAPPLVTSAAANPAAASFTPPTSMSPLRSSFDVRSSFDMSGFRLRSRSDVDTFSRQEQVREARRKFEAKQRAKDEKYNREQNRKRERADSKEAQKLDRAHSRSPKGSHASLPVGTVSVNAHRTRVSNPDRDMDDLLDEKPTTTGLPDPRAEDVQFKSPRRTRSAKHKTASAWTVFMLWLRTQFVKLGRR